MKLIMTALDDDEDGTNLPEKLQEITFKICMEYGAVIAFVLAVMVFFYYIYQKLTESKEDDGKETDTLLI